MIYYDAETLKNCFTLCAIDDNDNRWQFEISERRYDYHAFIEWLEWCMDTKQEMCGFNNLGFDSNLLWGIYTHGRIRIAQDIYRLAQTIIAGNLPQKQLIPQVDLFKIHHFDNKARMTSLKVLQFNMRLPVVDEMPFPHDQNIAPENIPRLLEYNWNDALSTRQFAHASKDKLDLRRELSEKYGRQFMNYSDSKIGKQIVIRELEAAGIRCYDKNGPRQTHRDGIPVSHILLPQIEFRSRAFSEALETFRELIIHETNGEFSLSCEARGVEFVFGFGGIHASVSGEAFESCADYVIMDADVTSYYPNMSIKHRAYPEHLGPGFIDVYQGVLDTRVAYKKQGLVNLSNAYKLGANSVYGDSNNPYSPFFDPQMTMSITINGQLFLAMLCEKLMWVPEFRIIQANTDGCTFLIPRAMLDKYNQICAEWMAVSQLNLEFAEYKKMCVRDVNNYLAVGVDGKVKTKGAYESKKEWHKDHSMLIVPKAAQAHLVDGADIETFVRSHADVFDFMARIKVNKKDRVHWNSQEFHGVVRYIITTDGHEMAKEMPALGPVGKFKKRKEIPWSRWQGETWDCEIHTKGKQKYELRKSRINAGQKVTVCNRLTGDEKFNIDYDFYIKEVRKLVDVFTKNS